MPQKSAICDKTEKNSDLVNLISSEVIPNVIVLPEKGGISYERYIGKVDYSSTLLEYNFERLVLYIVCYFVHLHHYNSEVNTVLLLHFIYLILLVCSQILF